VIRYASTCYARLGDRASADVGLMQAGMTVAMARIFVPPSQSPSGG
jgi:hypothetical protein